MSGTPTSPFLPCHRVAQSTLWTHVCTFCPFFLVVLQQPCEHVSMVLLSYLTGEKPIGLSAALSWHPAGVGWEPPPSGPQVCALNPQTGEDSGAHAQCPGTPRCLWGHRSAWQEAFFSPSDLSPHSRSTQPELLSVAGAHEMALTPWETSAGPVPHPTPPSPQQVPLWLGPLALAQPTASEPGLPAVSTGPPHSGAKPWHFPGLHEAKIPFQRNTSSVFQPSALSPVQCLHSSDSCDYEGAGTRKQASFQPSSMRQVMPFP